MATSSNVSMDRTTFTRFNVSEPAVWDKWQFLRGLIKGVRRESSSRQSHVFATHQLNDGKSTRETLRRM